MTTHDRRLSKLESSQPNGSGDFEPPSEMNILQFTFGVLGILLYPAQALVLKLITLSYGLLTEWDLRVLARWSGGYGVVNDELGAHYSGTEGIVPDWRERIAWCRQAGRWTFREVCLVLGRRASKSLLCAVVTTWQLWQLLRLPDPHAHFGLPAGKRIAFLTFSTNRGNAQRDQFGDVVGLLRNAPAFSPFIAKISDTTVQLYTQAQLRHGARQRGEPGLIELSAVSTTRTAARGPAVLGLMLDEFAHLDGAGSTSDAADIAQSATPAQGQFRNEAIVMMASSPWTMNGGFYKAHLWSCALDSVTGKARSPDTLTLQLPSFAMYEDWQIAHEIPQWPGGPNFQPITRPILAESDPALVALRMNDPRTYAVEILAQWASSSEAYFDEIAIQRAFVGPDGEAITAVTCPTPGVDYVLHVDPSEVGANTALIVAHAETIDGEVHVFVDVVDVWKPADFGGEIDYDVVTKEIARRIEVFRPMAATIDQFSGRVLAQQINKLMRPISAFPSLELAVGAMRQVSANATEKAARYETLKLLLAQGRIHIPFHPLLRDELRALERRGDRFGHPTTGPTRTDDMVDALTHDAAALMKRPTRTFRSGR